ncbi:MAG: hypothetical protein IPG45_37470 [Deltaproteobacteria bacterium]|nr:hypothetical protein [Deltaproteobacteria bacterium]
MDYTTLPQVTPMPNINIRNLDQYGLFQRFWHTHNDPDLSGGGLNELTQAGAQKLFEYATQHELNGQPSAGAQRKITPEEREVIKALLEHPHYGRFFEQDGRVKVMELFGLRAEEVHSPDALRPVDHGELHLPGRQSRQSEARLANVNIRQLPELFAAEYQGRRAEFEGRGTDEEKGLKTLALFRDYTQALWSRGEAPDTEAVGHALLDAFEKTRFGKIVGNKNFNGAPWGAAQSLALGLDPNHFPVDFPKAGSDVKTTYLAMNDAMAEPMGYVDQYLEKLGRETGAKAFELRSPLGFMIGEPNGHNKRGSLSEARPFASSGLNWGIPLFPGDAQIKDLPPKAGFEFKIDCLDGLGNFLRCDPKYGERLKVLDEQGNALKVEKIIHEEGGKAVSWSAKFTTAAGVEVPADKVLGVFVDRNDRIKGDKQTNKDVNMWWWGFCDRNTAQRLYKAKYGIPELDTDKVEVKAGRGKLEIPTAIAQKLLDADVPDIVTGESMCGFRFNNEPQQVSLKDGRTLQGRTVGDILEHAPGIQRLGQDYLAVYNDAKRPLFGTIDVQMADGHLETINTKNIKSITQAADGKVTIKVENAYHDTVEGTLKSEVDFAKAKREGDKLVLTQDETFPIRGDLRIELADGRTETVHVSNVNQIVGETSKEMRISQFATWVSQNQGMYATDASEREVVSNGMRWTNRIDNEVQQGDVRPAWAKDGELHGIHGPVVRQAGDHLVWMRGQYAYQPGAEANSTSFAGWVQVGKNGRILNEGFTEGQPDFGWSALGALDWKAKSSFNPYMDPELRIGILVNGVKALKVDGAETDAIAQRLNLPANWKDYRA